MQVHPAFRIDRAACFAFAAARSFGLVVGYDGGRPHASPLPFELTFRADGTPCARFHVARGNPLAALAGRGEDWLLAIGGADAYVSPEWYVSPEQVPTWLYESVHLSGPVRVMPVAETRAHLERLSAQFERPAPGAPAWTPGRLAAGRLAAMLQAIVGIEMEVAQIEGAAKLNQNKSDADFQATVRHLCVQDETMARQIAARMVALRPQLVYEMQDEDNGHG